MFANRWAKNSLILFAIFFVLSILSIDAWARAGGGGSSGSRGSRSYSAPRSTPAPAPTSPSRQGQMGAPAAPAPSPFGGGGFLRSMAGGLVGGMIGGMLFRSLGFAGGGMGGMGGGIGIMEIVLIGALLYGIYWFIKRKRREATSPPPPANLYRESTYPSAGRTEEPPMQQAYDAPSGESDTEAGLRHIRQMDPGFDERRFTDTCMDVFFRIQGAWANRDMSGIRNSLTDEMFRFFSGETDKLKAQKRINRLDNIAVRSVEITEIWQEKGEDFITVKVYANLLDYTMDEGTQELLSGSKTEPVKFNEYWTFNRPVGENPWKLSAINQVE